MGSYAPVNDLDPGVLARVRESVLEPAVAGLSAEGRPYRGALYAGLMLTSEGPMALEFNCRFGDPETQVILPLLDLDLAELLVVLRRGTARDREHLDAPGVAVCVVLAAEGYPERPRAGDPIHGIECALQTGALVFHAGTGDRDEAARHKRWSGALGRRDGRRSGRRGGACLRGGGDDPVRRHAVAPRRGDVPGIPAGVSSNVNEPARVPLRRIAVLASGSGTNLQALLDATGCGTLEAEVAVVVSDRADAGALRRAAAAGVATVSLPLADRRDAVVREAYDRRLADGAWRLRA